MRAARIISRNGRVIEVTATDQTREGFYAEPDRDVYGVAYFLGRDGSVEKQRWGTGRNAGEFKSAKRMNARWEWVKK